SVARTLARQAEVEYVEVPGGRHAMLRHGAVFERAAAEFAAETLLGGLGLSAPARRGGRPRPRR
ncbi:MAG TPA: hypothetical protein VGD85_08630, partial [Nocardioides sp.]